MTVIIKHYIIIIGTMKNNYLYNVMLKSKKKIIKIKFKNGKGNPRMLQNKTDRKIQNKIDRILLVFFDVKIIV